LDPDPPNPERTDPVVSSPTMLGLFITGFLFLMGVIVAVWKIDEHFVTRREFQSELQSLKKAINRIGVAVGTESLYPDEDQ
jgi:hypothetical protein